MSKRTRPAIVAVLVVTAMVGAACTGGSARNTKSSTTTTTLPVPSRSVAVSPIVGPATTAASVMVSIHATTTKQLRVVFHGTALGGTLAQWQAAGWGAVTVATLLTGAPLTNREIEFNVTGSLSGLSAGALMTVAVIALIRGDTVGAGITMSGAINPDGSIVGALPANTSAGQPKGMRVVRAGDIYDAYKQFTGVALPQLPPSSDTTLDASANEKLRAEVETSLAKYTSALTDFESLPPGVRRDLASYEAAAAQARERATALSDQGLQPGAFEEALTAAALMNAVAQAGQSLPVLLAQGPVPFVAKIRASQSISDEVSGLLATLSAFRPQTVSDAGTLTGAYGNAIDAVSLSRLATSLFRAPAANPQQAITQAAQGAIYYDLAGSLVDASNDILSVGQGLGGPAPSPSVDPSDLARLFLKASRANLAAFDAIVVAPVAKAQKSSNAAVLSELAAVDSDFALAQQGAQLDVPIPPSFGSGVTAGYAELGGAMSLYARTSELLSKYSSLGRANPGTLELTAISDTGAFSSAIRLAQSQLASNIGWLRAKDVSPLIAAADNEVAGAEQNGSVRDKFDALGDYWDGYLNSRALAYLGGFPAP